MNEPLAYFDGQLIPQSQMRIPIWDVGFVQGVAVAEQIRTFNGKLFHLDDHLERLRESLQIVGIDLGERFEDLPLIAERLVTTNISLLDPADDLGLSIFVTPGPYAAFAQPGITGPTLGLHTYPVAFAGFASKYHSGERLVVSSIRQVPESCWPPQLKCRSRMHYYLADQEAGRREAGARALLLDQEGTISEASTANFLLYRRGEGFLSPPREKILHGISLAVLQQLAQNQGERFTCRDLMLEEIWQCDEAFLCSTSPCLLPVVTVDGQPIGIGSPGPIFHKMIAAWGQMVGLDIVEQATRFQRRR